MVKAKLVIVATFIFILIFNVASSAQKSVTGTVVDVEGGFHSTAIIVQVGSKKYRVYDQHNRLPTPHTVVGNIKEVGSKVTVYYSRVVTVRNDYDELRATKIVEVGVSEPPAQEIRFAKGKSSATINGQIGSDEAEKKYYLAARYGQTMCSSISSRNNSVYLVGYGDNRTSECQQTNSGKVNWIVLKNSGQQPTNFTLTVSIR